MQQVQLNEQLYKEAQRRAAKAGFSSVDEYVADVLSHDILDGLGDTSANLDHFFTPERLAHIDQAAEQIESGQFFTAEESDTEFAKRRSEWIQKHSG